MKQKLKSFLEIIAEAEEIYESAKVLSKEEQTSETIIMHEPQQQDGGKLTSDHSGQKLKTEQEMDISKTSVHNEQKLNSEQETDSEPPKKMGRKSKADARRDKNYTIKLEPDLYVFLQEIVYFEFTAKPENKLTKTKYIEGLVRHEMEHGSSTDYRINLNEKGISTVRKQGVGNTLSIRFTKEMLEYILYQTHIHRISVTQYINVILREDMNRFMKEVQDKSNLTQAQQKSVQMISDAIEDAKRKDSP